MRRNKEQWERGLPSRAVRLCFKWYYRIFSSSSTASGPPSPILGKAVILRNIAIRKFSIKKLIPIYFSHLTKGGILFLQPKQMLKLPEIAQIGETGNQNMTTTGYVCHAKKNTVKYTHLTHFHIYHSMSVADVLLHQ